MPNITLSVDEEILKKARKVAIDRNTTLTEMIREYLLTLVRRSSTKKRRAVEALRQSFKKHGRDMGRRTWMREDLSERSRP
jgi:hypothetical protein